VPQSDTARAGLTLTYFGQQANRGEVDEGIKEVLRTGRKGQRSIAEKGQKV
jgi:hypothetical protein